MPTKTPTRPDVTAARNRVATASIRYTGARDHLHRLEVDGGDPRERSKSTWVTAHDAARREVVESAQDLEDARRSLAKAEEQDLAWRVTRYQEALPDIRQQRNVLAQELDDLLVDVDRVAKELIRLCEEERQAATGAEVSGPDLERVRRTLVSRLGFALPSLRLRPDLKFTVHTHARKPLAEIFMPVKQEEVDR